MKTKRSAVIAGILGTLSCCSPMGPDSDPNIKTNTTDEETIIPIHPSTSKEAIVIQLLVGNIKYDSAVDGPDWRATFEVKVFLPTGENIRESCDVAFYNRMSSSVPFPISDKWEQAEKLYKNGLTSISGNWTDRVLGKKELAYPWVKAQVSCTNINENIIGKCNFYEKRVNPKKVWIEEDDIQYGLSERVLATIFVPIIEENKNKNKDDNKKTMPNM